MKRTNFFRAVSVLAIALALARELKAQVVAPAPTQGQITQSERFVRPASQTEWVRGYRFGQEQGFWTGMRDSRAGLSPSRFVMAPVNVRLTPYHHGYATGFVDGYRRGFVYIR